jgi:hypothetical protein
MPITCGYGSSTYCCSPAVKKLLPACALTFMIVEVGAALPTPVSVMSTPPAHMFSAS